MIIYEAYFLNSRLPKCEFYDWTGQSVIVSHKLNFVIVVKVMHFSTTRCNGSDKLIGLNQNAYVDLTWK